MWALSEAWEGEIGEEARGGAACHFRGRQPPQTSQGTRADSVAC